MSHRKGGDETEMKVRKKKGRDSREAVVEMDTSKKYNKTQGVDLIIVTSDAVTSLIFKFFAITAFFQNLQQRTEHPSKV